MSDGEHRPERFFDLYCRDEASEDEIDDFIDDWHDRPEGGRRSLPHHLGMTGDEYAVFVIDARILPLIRTAPMAKRPLAEAVRGYVRELLAAGDPDDQPAVLALTNWCRTSDARG